MTNYEHAIALQIECDNLRADLEAARKVADAIMGIVILLRAQKSVAEREDKLIDRFHAADILSSAMVKIDRELSVAVREYRARVEAQGKEGGE